jgi:hypothetical protein
MTYTYGIKATDIVAWTYAVERWHGECLVENMILAGELSPAARDMDPADAFEQHANANAYEDLYEDCERYDSNFTPQPIFGSDELNDICGKCHTAL